MDWIKQNRNLVIIGLITLLAIGGAGFYFYSKWSADAEASQQLADMRARLEDLQGRNPYPNQENLAAIKEQEAQLMALRDRAQKFFQPLPNYSNINVANFSSVLVGTLAELKRNADRANVTVPTNFAFGFTVQRKSLQFDTGSLPRVISQLDDVRAVCEILFQARVYELNSVRRAPAAPNDKTAMETQAEPQDYLPAARQVTTNTSVNALVVPYEIGFKCSAVELVNTLNEIARAPQGIIVKYIKVDPIEEVTPEGETPGVTPTDTTPAFNPYGRYGRGMSGAMMRRYGMMGGGMRGGMDMVPAANQPPKNKIGTILKDKPFKVGLGLEVVKFLAAK